MIDEPNRDEDYPQDYLSADGLPDEPPTLDADLAGDHDPDVRVCESAPAAAAESTRERAAREYEEALGPYLEKRVRLLSEYVADVASEWAMFGESADDPGVGDTMLAEANKRRELDKFMVRKDAEQDYRQAQLEAIALGALRRHETEGGDER